MLVKQVAPTDHYRPYSESPRASVSPVKKLKILSSKIIARRFIAVDGKSQDFNNLSSSNKYIQSSDVVLLSGCKPTCFDWLLTLTVLLLAAGLLTTTVLLFTIRCATTVTTTTTTTATTVTTTTTSTVSTTTTSITTTSTTTTTATTSICSSIGRGTLLSLNDTTPSTWTQYSLTFTATSNIHTLSFGFQNENNREYYLDDVSVVDNSMSSIQLLQNPSFENSTLAPTGWFHTCASSCTSGIPAKVVSGSNCFASSGNCIKDNCYASTGIDFLSQSFPTTIGRTYTLSFQLIQTGGGISIANRFFVDIL